jgi:hypothetical protein
MSDFEFIGRLVLLFVAGGVAFVVVVELLGIGRNKHG